MVDRCRRHARLDQLDPPPVDDLVAGRRGDRHGPAEMVSNAQTHAVEYRGYQLCDGGRWPQKLGLVIWATVQVASSTRSPPQPNSTSNPDGERL